MALKNVLKLSLVCLLAAAANFLLNGLVTGILKVPLFLDTLFTVAVTFAAGLLPGIVTAILSTIIVGLRYETTFTYFFVLCSIAEVFLVWAFCRRTATHRSNDVPVSRVPTYTAINTAASLLLLALVDCVLISIIGGLIDYTIFVLMSLPRNTFFPEDVFKIGLLRNDVPLLWANILSRFPINLVDRIVVIAGGYGVSLLLHGFAKQKKLPR
jgi:hypothetical protein